MTAAWRWNHPPNWPPAPAGWTPPPGWSPPEHWPPAPFGWSFWVADPPAASLPPRSYAGPHQVLAARGERPVIEMVIAAGAGLVALSTILPWISVALLGSLNLFDLYTADQQTPVIPGAVVVSCGVVAVLGFTGKPAMGTAALVLGLIDAIGGTLYVLAVINGVRAADGFASVGTGPWIAGLGVITLIVAGAKAMREGYG